MQNTTETKIPRTTQEWMNTIMNADDEKMIVQTVNAFSLQCARREWTYTCTIAAGVAKIHQLEANKKKYLQSLRKKYGWTELEVQQLELGELLLECPGLFNLKPGLVSTSCLPLPQKSASKCLLLRN